MSISIGNRKQIKYCLDNYSNIAKYIYNRSLNYYDKNIFLGDIYKILCDEGLYFDEFINANKSKVSFRLSSLKEEVNKKGNKIKAESMDVFKNIQSAADKYSEKVNKVGRIKECVDVYKDWMTEPEGPSLAMRFIQMSSKVTLIIKDMIKKLKFSDSDKKELDVLYNKSIGVAKSINTDTKMTNIVKYVIYIDKLNTNNPIKMKIEVNKMYKMAKECQ